MSRHRIVRTMDYKDEYDSYDDVYGHSVDDDNCISPTDASQWIYDRAKGQQSISAFMANNRNIEEENEDEDEEGNDIDLKKRRDSENFQMPELDDIEQGKLLSCIDGIRSVVGDTISERQIVETAMKHEYNLETSLNVILNITSATATISSKPSVIASSSKDITLAAKSLKNSSINTEKDFKKNIKTETNPNINRLDEYFKNLKFPNKSNSGVSIPIMKIDNNNSTTKSKLNKLIGNRLTDVKTGSVFNDNLVKDSLKNDLFLSKVNMESSSSSPLSLKSISHKSKIDEKQFCVTKISDFNLTDNNTISKNSNKIDLTKILTQNSAKDDQCDIIRMNKKQKIIDPNEITNQIRKSNLDLSLLISNSNLYGHKLRLQKKPSNFAKVLKLKYKCNNNPIIKHDWMAKHHLESFKFDSKSPDDLSLIFLQK